MTNVQENPGAQRTRRNIMKTGPILASAVADGLLQRRGYALANLTTDNDNRQPGQWRRYELFPEGNKDSDGRGRAQGRGPRDWRFAADDVRRAASRPMDRTLSFQEE